ncbi:MAG: aminotransferase class IV [Planctomycetes bacterium]|nr:aminotransferase class IV [Planctomycetota bacterium]
MSEPTGFINGQLVPASQASIALADQGFTLGVTVSEQLRTFAGRLFQPEEHLQRLLGSLRIVGLELPLAADRWLAQAAELAELNHRLLPTGHDLQMTWFVTPGLNAQQPGHASIGPTFGMTTFPLPFARWADKYATGDRLVTSRWRQVPTECWPAELKCRSRMHYYLAEQDAQQREPGSRPLLLDIAGNVSETPTVNVLAVFGAKEIVSPPRKTILPGISLAVVEELAAATGLTFHERTLTPAELAGADEVLLTSTPFCVLPVVALDGRPIGKGQPGPVFARLMAAWSKQLGVDIMAQARQFSG